MATLKLTKTGYEQFLSDLSKKEEELRQLGIYKGKEAVEHGDVWHDNYSFEQVEIQERALIRTISDMKYKLKDVEIIEESFENSSVVNIGSTVEVQLTFSEDDIETLTVSISGDYSNKKDSSIISVNSPLACCIIGKSIGYSGYYEVNSLKIKATILNIT